MDETVIPSSGVMLSDKKKRRMALERRPSALKADEPRYQTVREPTSLVVRRTADDALSDAIFLFGVECDR